VISNAAEDTNNNVTLTFNGFGSFTLSANATATAASSSLTFTDSDGNSFVHFGSTTNSNATVRHIPRYDSIPLGYTRKHFKFYRENTIGARRRTYEGTQNTETTSVDLGPPFEIFDVNVNTITVGTTTNTNTTTNTGTNTSNNTII
jgi:hypothetical protein